MAFSTSQLSLYFFVLFSVSCNVFALTTRQRQACQSPTRNPLSGCPAHTLLVDPSTSNSTTKKSSTTFSAIQSAILSLPHDNSARTILILPGQYTEQLNITRPGPLYLLGQTKSPKDVGSNDVEVLWHQATGTATTGTLDNAYTAVLTIAPTLNSSLTGSGPTGNPVPADTPFGCTDFRAYNLNFTNDYLPYSAGPSLALSTSYANSGFYYSVFQSYQDTIYVGKLANSYMKHSVIGGQTDFLYGFGTLYIESSDLQLRGCGGGITAWKGTNTTFVNKYGVYIHSSSVKKENSTLQIAGKCALGRPWNAQHRSVFANSYLDDSIRPSGYIAWSATDPRVNNYTFMAEYKDFGPGWNLTGRIEGNVTRVLDERSYAPYSSPAKVFQYFKSGRTGNDKWIDAGVLSNRCQHKDTGRRELKHLSGDCDDRCKLAPGSRDKCWLTTARKRRFVGPEERPSIARCGDESAAKLRANVVLTSCPESSGQCKACVRVVQDLLEQTERKPLRPVAHPLEQARLLGRGGCGRMSDTLVALARRVAGAGGERYGLLLLLVLFGQGSGLRLRNPEVGVDPGVHGLVLLRSHHGNTGVAVGAGQAATSRVPSGHTHGERRRSRETSHRWSAIVAEKSIVLA
ncbi:pectin lyase fold/virulence factor [Lophiotrema nucula]|uniref:pectinesterase n=1 Tax=Lophiotrema nucula TaxID=690887 RepID=A0A6A5YP17_9PLEO|nr:pectin lyase fold/virulence factor [Lophiotrema nucula]